MTKHDKKKLSLSTHTVRALQEAQLERAAGGYWSYNGCSWWATCPPPPTPACPM